MTHFELFRNKNKFSAKIRFITYVCAKVYSFAAHHSSVSIYDILQPGFIFPYCKDLNKLT